MAVLVMSGLALATDGTCNGTLACSGNPTVGDNRNGQTVGTGQIANGGVSSSTSAGGAASIAAGAVNNTNMNTSAGGSSSIAAGAVQNTLNGGTHTASVGNTSAVGGAVGNTSSTSGGNTLSTGASTSSVSGIAGVNGGITTSINIADNSSTVAAAAAVAKGQVDAARLLADATRDQKIRNTPSTSLGALTASNDTCMGSTNAGGSGPGFSLAIGSTWTDSNCKMLKNSRELWNMGMRGAAMALMCTDSSNRDALELTGYECPQTARENGRKLSNGQVEQPQYTDPIVRARMGMAPLK